MSVMVSAVTERAALGHALGQARRGPGERRKVHPSAHQGVVEQHDPERAFGLGIQLRQPFGQCLHARRIGDERCVIQAGCPTDGG